MAKKENKTVIVGEKEEVVFLGHFVVRCPYCNHEIGIPQYRQQPVTLEEMRRQTRALIKSMKKAKRNV